MMRVEAAQPISAAGWPRKTFDLMHQARSLHSSSPLQTRTTASVFEFSRYLLKHTFVEVNDIAIRHIAGGMIMGASSHFQAIIV